MELIEKHDTKGFQKYLDETDNTICGRNPILILLNVKYFSNHEYLLLFINNSSQILKHSALATKLKTKFVKYAQSNACKSKKDSSVSYAAGVTYIEP